MQHTLLESWQKLKFPCITLPKALVENYIQTKLTLQVLVRTSQLRKTYGEWLSEPQRGKFSGAQERFSENLSCSDLKWTGWCIVYFIHIFLQQVTFCLWHFSNMYQFCLQGDLVSQRLLTCVVWAHQNSVSVGLVFRKKAQILHQKWFIINGWVLKLNWMKKKNKET